MRDRLLLYLERVGIRRVLVVLGAAAVLLAAAIASAVVLGGGSGSSAGTTTGPTTNRSATNLFYLRALAAKVRIRGCAATIHFVWKPDYHAIQYLDTDALITTAGPNVAGSYTRHFTRKGVALTLGPVSLAGGYQRWSATVTSLDGDPPGNDTTIYAASPTGTSC